MEKEVKKCIKNGKDILDKVDSGIVATDNGIVIFGILPDVLTHLASIVHGLSGRGIPKEVLQDAFELGVSSDKELLKKLKEAIKEFVNKKDEENE